MSNKKINILIFIDSFRVGGMHKQILYLARYLNREIFELIICTSSSNGGLKTEYEQTGRKLIDLGWKRSFDLAVFKQLIKVLKFEKPDIIFITMAQNLVYFRLSNLFLKNKIIQIGSFRALTFWHGHLGYFYNIIDRLMCKWLYASSDHIVVNSFAMKAHYDHLLNPKLDKPIKVIYNSSDFNFRIDKSKLQIRKELNIGANELMMVMVARLDPWKDFETIFEAIRIIKDKGSQVKLIVLGDGILKGSLNQLILDKSLGKIINLIGEIKDASNYINACDISVLSTNGEGFSNTILESMALAKPVIATAIGGNIEVIGTDGKTGLLIPPKSSNLFAEAIMMLEQNEDLREQMGSLAKEKIYGLCDIKAYASSYENLFLSAMNKHI